MNERINELKQSLSLIQSKKDSLDKDGEMLISFSCDFIQDNKSSHVRDTIVIKVDITKINDKKELLKQIKLAVAKEKFKKINDNNIKNFMIMSMLW